MTRINISITDEETIDLLQELASKTGVPSYANLVRLAVKAYSNSWAIQRKVVKVRTE